MGDDEIHLYRYWIYDYEPKIQCDENQQYSYMILPFDKHGKPDYSPQNMKIQKMLTKQQKDELIIKLKNMMYSDKAHVITPVGYWCPMT